MLVLNKKSISNFLIWLEIILIGKILQRKFGLCWKKNFLYLLVKMKTNRELSRMLGKIFPNFLMKLWRVPFNRLNTLSKKPIRIWNILDRNWINWVRFYFIISDKLFAGKFCVILI